MLKRTVTTYQKRINRQECKHILREGISSVETGQKLYKKSAKRGQKGCKKGATWEHMLKLQSKKGAKSVQKVCKKGAKRGQKGGKKGAKGVLKWGKKGRRRTSQ